MYLTIPAWGKINVHIFNNQSLLYIYHSYRISSNKRPSRIHRMQRVLNLYLKKYGMTNFLVSRVVDVMTSNPISINPDALAAKALSIMNEKKITCLCVNSKKSKKKTIGIIHIHNILEANVN